MDRRGEPGAAFDADDFRRAGFGLRRRRGAPVQLLQRERDARQLVAALHGRSSATATSTTDPPVGNPMGPRSGAGDTTLGVHDASKLLDQCLELLAARSAELVLFEYDTAESRTFKANRGDVASTEAGRNDVANSVALDGSTGRLGVLTVWTPQGTELADIDRRLLDLFAEHASTAIQNSDLVDQLRSASQPRELRQPIALPERVMFELQVLRAIATRSAEGSVAVAVIDIDHFKEVNDTLGHHWGDELLAELGRRLERVARDEGLIVSRLGGDEFGVLIPRATSTAAIETIVGSVKRAIEDPVEIADMRVDISSSVGISVVDGSSGTDTASSMLREADVAMYVAKSARLGILVYDAAHDPRSPKRLSLETDLRHAVDSGEVEVYFQPQVDLVTGDTIAVEALARWTHPVHGTIVPHEFIPIAEQSGLICDLTYLILEQSLERVREWRDRGFDLRLAVNLSARCLAEDDLVDRVTHYLELVGLEPGHLTVETTDSEIMADPDRAQHVLGQLRAQGVRLCLDDFGTGYLSLAQLRRVPIDQLKISRSLVTDVSDDHDAAAIVDSVIALGHHLGLDVTADGVEDQSTLDKLIELGCDSVQGFYLARPMSAEQTLRWLSREASDIDREVAPSTGRKPSRSA